MKTDVPRSSERGTSVFKSWRVKGAASLWTRFPFPHDSEPPLSQVRARQPFRFFSPFPHAPYRRASARDAALSRQHAVRRRKNRIVRRADDPGRNDDGAARLAVGSRNDAGGVVGPADGANIPAEHELPALLPDENRIMAGKPCCASREPTTSPSIRPTVEDCVRSSTSAKLVTMTACPSDICVWRFLTKSSARAYPTSNNAVRRCEDASA